MNNCGTSKGIDIPCTNIFLKLYRGDSIFSIDKINKGKQTFNFLRTKFEGPESRTELKERNRELHNFLYEKKHISIQDLVSKFMKPSFFKFESKGNYVKKIMVSKAVFVHSYDGNQKMILCEDNNYFYFIKDLN
jgi:hypothetical protein